MICRFVRRLLTILLLLSSFGLLSSHVSAVDLSYYLSEPCEYDAKVSTPEQYFGFQVGDRHLQHHELVGYAKRLSEQSKRVRYHEYARTHGQRPLTVLVITSPKNHQRLEKIRSDHLRLADPEVTDEVRVESLPAVIWMGYGVHGNEPSAANAAPLVAYHLAAGQSDWVKQVLDNTVILLDPCLNPDGFERFAHWANNHRGQIANGDPNHREHREGSPTGRSNYYWFDLNRDWLPVQHPESQGRLSIYHQWLPNVVLDFHEMGGDATYFFQPGVPTRMHPLTPEKNLEFTRKFAAEHAKSLNDIGALYFTEEKFDDFYMGKGSTYPDLHGAVGILFEQASARGQQQDFPNGRLEFPFAIRNQVRTSLTSLNATVAERVSLHEYKRDFYRQALEQANASPTKGFVFSAGADRSRAREFLRILSMHKIQVCTLVEDVELEGHKYLANESFFIPADQPEFPFLMAMTERRTEFKDPVFYDISAWSLPLAFGLAWSPINEALPEQVVGEPVEQLSHSGRDITFTDNDYAYIVDWNDQAAAHTLARLLEADVNVRVAQKSFTAETSAGERSFQEGALLIPLGVQAAKLEEIREILTLAVLEHDVDVSVVFGGLTPDGVDLGSSSFAKLTKPKVLMVVGTNTDDYESGEVWHLFDRRLQLPITMVDSHLLASTNLSSYTTIVLVSGTYSNVSAAGIERLQQWLKQGGNLIALGTAGRWLNSAKIVTLKSRVQEEDEKSPVTRMPYAVADEQAAMKSIEGTIFEVQIDRTHPLGFGFQSETLPVFRDHTYILEPSSNAYSTPAVYSNAPLLSGYASQENQLLLSGSAAVVVKSEGAGRVIAIPNNPLFRSFWRGSERFFLNSLFFGPVVREP